MIPNPFSSNGIGVSSFVAAIAALRSQDLVKIYFADMTFTWQTTLREPANRMAVVRAT